MMGDKRRQAGSVCFPIETDACFEPPVAAVSPLPRTALVSGMLAAAAAEQIILLDAPAGFGKSTCLALYRDRQLKRGLAVAWLTLDEGHNDPRAFCRDLIDAVARCGVPSAESHARLALCRVARDFASVVLSLLNQIARGSSPLCLILDDVHLLQSSETRPLLQAVLSRAGASLQVALAGRGSPALSPAQLWASGRIARLGALELCFSEDEVAGCLAGVLAPAQAKQIWVKTEGWPIAVQLCRLSLAQRRSTSDALLEFGGEPPELADYLTASVIDHLPEALRKSLLKLSILDVIAPDLVEVLCGREAAATLLPTLERLQLFVRSARGPAGGTQFHPMFLGFLRRQARELDQHELSELHRRAAARYREQGALGYAAKHLIAAGDVRAALEMLEREGRSIARLESDSVVLQHLDRVAEAELDAFPRLKLALIYHWAQSGRAERALYALSQLNTMATVSTESGASWEDARLICEATVYTYLGRKFSSETRAALEHCLLDREPRERGVRLAAAGLLVCDYYERCELIRIIEITADVGPEESSTEGYVHLYLLCYRVLALTGLGKLVDAFMLCAEIESRSRRLFGAGTDLSSVCRSLQVSVLHLQGRISEAWQLARSVMADLEHGCGWFDVQIEAYRSVAALVHLRVGRAAADEFLVRATARARCGGYTTLAVGLEIERAALAQRCGAGEDAERIVDQAGLAALVCEPGAEQLPRRLLASIRMVLCSIASSRKQTDVAQEHLDAATAQLRPEAALDLQIRLHLARAALRRASGAQADALRATRDALQLAAAHGIVAPLLEDRQHLASIRTLGSERGSSGSSSREHAARCLAAFESEYQAPAGQRLNDASKAVTQRESQVLELLASGCTNKEIALRLQISPETARIHRKRLAHKLGARTRSEAIAAGRRLGLLREAALLSQASPAE